MPKNNDLQMPEEIRCKRINLVQRNHDYDRQCTIFSTPTGLI